MRRRRPPRGGTPRRTSPRTGRGRARRFPAASSTRFVQRATDMASTVERVSAPEEIPAAVARYVDALDLPPAIAEQKSRRGVCWPELALLDWRAAGLDIEARPTTGHDRLAITGCFCAIAETGTLVFTSGADTPTAPDAVAGYARRHRARGPHRRRHGRGICARARGEARAAACRQPDLGPFAHRRHRADDRTRGPRSVPDARAGARLGLAFRSKEPTRRSSPPTRRRTCRAGGPWREARACATTSVGRPRARSDPRARAAGSSAAPPSPDTRRSSASPRRGPRRSP